VTNVEDERQMGVHEMAPHGQVSSAPATVPIGDSTALQLLERVGGRTLVREMVALFLREAPRRIATARDGLERGDLAVVQGAAHALKSSAGQMGARTVQEISTHLEMSTDPHVMAEWLGQLPGELERYTVWLGDLVASEAP
jgi:HPt (histidine-containing phosphotransfer) domain-containing protein